MRLLDKKYFSVIDPSHFRFVLLTGNKLLFYNKDEKETNAESIEYGSPEEAETYFQKIKKEASWFSFSHNDKEALINTFSFKMFYVDKEKCDLCFYNSDNDNFPIHYSSLDRALADLKKLLIYDNS